MTDIKIERRRASVWPWVLGLLVLAVLVWGLVELFDREPVVAGAAPAATQHGVPVPAAG